jgi:anthranilate phosphoribosyltransferase
LGVAAGLVAAAAGTPVVVHSDDRVPTQKQDAYEHVLDELCVRTDLSPAASARMTDEVGFGFYYRPNFAPGVAALFDRREEMGVRTFLNIVEMLANLAAASTHLGSFLAPPVRDPDHRHVAREPDCDSRPRRHVPGPGGL